VFVNCITDLLTDLLICADLDEMGLGLSGNSGAQTMCDKGD